MTISEQVYQRHRAAGAALGGTYLMVDIKRPPTFLRVGDDPAARRS